MATIDGVDITVILSQSIALLSVVASIISVCISAKSEYKLRTAELFFNAKSKAYQDFLVIATAVDRNSEPIDIKKLWATASVVFLYCSDTAYEMVSQYVAATVQYQLNGTKDSKDAMSNAYADAVLALQGDLKASMEKERFQDKLYWHFRRKRK